MEQITLKMLEEALGVKAQGNKTNFKPIKHICTDTRNILKDSLFVPIKGEKFDGHDYIDKALDNGAVAFITHKDLNTNYDYAYFKVDDTTKALGRLAKWYKSLFPIVSVGVTGSVGKTGTKDMISSVLRTQKDTLATLGNLNNHIGLPLTVFRMGKSTQVAVFEMGMSGFGEIEYLTDIVKPSIAIITNIGQSHIEKLGSRQNILKAKLEIIKGLTFNGTLVINGDDNLLYGVKDLLDCNVLTFGMDEGNDFFAQNVESLGENGIKFDIKLDNKEYSIKLNVPGVHNVYNALAAIAVGRLTDVITENIMEGLKNYQSEHMRLNIINNDRIKIINDAYNSSPQSAVAAIDVLTDISRDKRHIAILGDMLELGEYTESLHRDVGKYIAKKHLNALFTLGKDAKYFAMGAAENGMNQKSIFMSESMDELEIKVKQYIKKGDVILVKGSRGMGMEKIIDKLTT